jgi:hypothetical protein
MNRLALVASTITIVILSCWVVAMAQPDQFQACISEGHSAPLCAACTNASRGSGTSGSTADCLCQTQLAELGQQAFNDTYGSFGKCIQLEHAHGVQ